MAKVKVREIPVTRISGYKGPTSGMLRVTYVVQNLYRESLRGLKGKVLEQEYRNIKSCIDRAAVEALGKKGGSGTGGGSESGMMK